MFDSNYSKFIHMSNFHPLFVVGSDSETQIQMGKNWNYLIWRFKGYSPGFTYSKAQ